MGSPAPALTPTSCCVTLLPLSPSHLSLSEPESGEMRATEPRSPTPTVLLQRPTVLHLHLLLHHLPVCHRPNNIHHLPNWSNTNIIICTITSSNYPFYSPKMLLMTIVVSILVTSSATMGTSSS